MKQLSIEAWGLDDFPDRLDQTEYLYREDIYCLEYYCRLNRLNAKSRIAALARHGSLAVWLKQLEKTGTLPPLKRTSRGLKNFPSYQGSELPIKLIPYNHQAYPASLRRISNPPAWFYLLGQDLVTLKRGPVFCVVGSRRASSYGEAVCCELIKRLAGRPVTIVSGLALGIDGIAHKTALSVGLNSVAVLGCGVDIVYPQANRAIYLALAEHGSILSEWPPGTRPQARFFPSRNRLLSALSDIVVVVEANDKSGSLITAGYAADQSKDVYAVPGSLFLPQSRGCHKLIAEGAQPVESLDCLLDLVADPIDEPVKDLLEFIHFRAPSPEKIREKFGRDALYLVNELELKNELTRRGKNFLLTDRGLARLQKMI